jgi:hypothetical protein
VTYADLSNVELENLSSQLADTYEGYRTAGLNLDLTRGKPAADQLDLSDELDGILNGFFLLQDGTDVYQKHGSWALKCSIVKPSTSWWAATVH